MKKFKFNLTALLKIRKRYEDRVKQEFADQQRRVEEQRQALEKMKLSRSKTDQALKAAMAKDVDIAMEKSYDDYLQALQKNIHESEEQLGLLKQELERRRRILIKAQQDVQVLEKIKEHRYETYKKELTKEEQAFLDEIAISQKRVQDHLRRVP